MAQRFIGINGYSREAKKIIKRVVKTYKKFGFLSRLENSNQGYRFEISDGRFELLSNEIRLSFMEAGLI